MRVSTADHTNVDPLDAVAVRFVGLVRTMQRSQARLAALVPILWDPATCPNCDAPAPDHKRLFCGELCSQEARFVRYARATFANGRYGYSGVRRSGFGISLIMLANGGYPTQARLVAPEIREHVRHRDDGRCRLCGEPGTAIDHIDGDDSTTANLQLLCTECNTRKMAAGIVTITSESHPTVFAFIEHQRKRLAARTASLTVLRICDNEKSWKDEWRSHQRCAIEARSEAH